MTSIALRDLQKGAYFRLKGRLGRVMRQDAAGTTVIEYADEDTAKTVDGATVVETVTLGGALNA